MRPGDIVLLAISVLILLLIGFTPLLTGSGDRAARIRRECEFFYSPDGPDAVQNCLAKMGERGSAGSAK